MPVEVDFWTRYSSLCLKAKVCPLQSVFKRLKGTEFHCVVDVIRSENWPFLLAALSVDNSLTKIQFVSNHFSEDNHKDIRYERKRKSGLQFPVPYGCSEKNVSDICRCIAQILSNSKVLAVLKLENLYLKEEDALILEKPFKDSCVEQFSLSGCKFQEDAFEIICRGLQLSIVQWLDFSSCDLNASSLPFVCKIIKAHNLRRSNEMFQHTLRYQLPVFNVMKGLDRITLNNNIVTDEAVEMLINSFCEDGWIKALDLQKCCIGNSGANLILNVIKRNAVLQLVDLRLNDIDEGILDKIALQLALNNVGKVIKYHVGSMWKPSKNTKRISNRKIYLRTKILKHSPSKRKLLKKETPRASMMVKSKNVVTEEASSQTTLNYDIISRASMLVKSENISTEEASSQTTLNYDNKLRKAKKLMSKHSSLLNVLKKYKRENHLLQKEIENLSMQDDYILIDHETFSEVRNTFEKFKKFLDIMKEYGLWECVAIIEANGSAGNILKPLVLDATKKCLKILKSDSFSERISQSTDNGSLNDLTQEMLRLKKHTDHCIKQKQEHQSKEMHKDSINKPKLLSSRVLPEMNYVKKPMPSDKALAQKVFKEVMKSYTSSSHSSDPAKPMPDMFVHTNKKDVFQVSKIKDSLSETANKMKQLKMTKDKFSSISNDHTQSIADHISVSSHLPSTSTQLRSKSPKDLTNKINPVIENGKAIESIRGNSLSSSKTLSDGTSTRRKSSEMESDHSSTYKTLPDFKQKLNPLPGTDEDIKSELLSKKESIVHSSKTNTKSSPSKDNQIISNSESSKSSKNSKAKVVSHKSKSHSSSSNSKHITLVTKQPIPEVPENKAVFKSSSSAVSVSSYSSKNSFVGNYSVHSSAEEIGSEKSYLESVDEASTDKDVKSLSEEVYSSEDGKAESNKSVNINTELKEQVQEESSHPAGEMHSELIKKSVQSGSIKSSEIKLTLKKAVVEVPGEKSGNHNKSDSSMPSLSDITTVSSHSLNTDSVMGQLSD